jgi:hypothetical protein
MLKIKIGEHGVRYLDTRIDVESAGNSRSFVASRSFLYMFSTFHHQSRLKLDLLLVYSNLNIPLFAFAMRYHPAFGTSPTQVVWSSPWDF